MTAALPPKKKPRLALPSLDSSFFSSPSQTGVSTSAATVAAGLREGQRQRSSPHVVGQFPSLVYVPVPADAAASLLEASERYLTTVSSSDVLGGRPFVPLAADGLHVSLSRDFMLFRDTLDPFCDALEGSVRGVREFSYAVDTGRPRLLVNDAGTRLFLAFGVCEGGARFISLVREAVDPVLERFGAAERYYDECDVHVSVASVVPCRPIDSEALSELRQTLQTTVETEGTDQETHEDHILHVRATKVLCKRGDRCFVVKLVPN